MALHLAKKEAVAALSATLAFRRFDRRSDSGDGDGASSSSRDSADDIDDSLRRLSSILGRDMNSRSSWSSSDPRTMPPAGVMAAAAAVVREGGFVDDVSLDSDDLQDVGEKDSMTISLLEERKRSSRHNFSYVEGTTSSDGYDTSYNVTGDGSIDLEAGEYAPNNESTSPPAFIMSLQRIFESSSLDIPYRSSSSLKTSPARTPSAKHEGINSSSLDIPSRSLSSLKAFPPRTPSGNHGGSNGSSLDIPSRSLSSLNAPSKKAKSSKHGSSNSLSWSGRRKKSSTSTNSSKTKIICTSRNSASWKDVSSSHFSSYCNYPRGSSNSLSWKTNSSKSKSLHSGLRSRNKASRHRRSHRNDHSASWNDTSSSHSSFLGSFPRKINYCPRHTVRKGAGENVVVNHDSHATSSSISSDDGNQGPRHVDSAGSVNLESAVAITAVRDGDVLASSLKADGLDGAARGDSGETAPATELIVTDSTTAKLERGAAPNAAGQAMRLAYQEVDDYRARLQRKRSSMGEIGDSLKGTASKELRGLLLENATSISIALLMQRALLSDTVDTAGRDAAPAETNSSNGMARSLSEHTGMDRMALNTFLEGFSSSASGHGDQSNSDCTAFLAGSNSGGWNSNALNRFPSSATSKRRASYHEGTRIGAHQSNEPAPLLFRRTFASTPNRREARAEARRHSLQVLAQERSARPEGPCLNDLLFGSSSDSDSDSDSDTIGTTNRMHSESANRINTRSMNAATAATSATASPATPSPSSPRGDGGDRGNCRGTVRPRRRLTSSSARPRGLASSITTDHGASHQSLGSVLRASVRLSRMTSKRLLQAVLVSDEIVEADHIETVRSSDPSCDREAVPSLQERLEAVEEMLEEREEELRWAQDRFQKKERVMFTIMALLVATIIMLVVVIATGWMEKEFSR